MKFSIRRTFDEDLIKNLHTHTFPSDEYYKHNGNYYWIIRNDLDQPAGFCIATDIGSKILFLSRAGILKPFRGWGLHIKLIQVRERFAKTNGFDSIITYTTKDNYASFCNLIKRGFKLYDPDWEYAGSNVFYFMKDLK